jgi:hypothetical protein
VTTSYSGPERRRMPRLAISLSAYLRERGRPGCNVRLLDLSALGCRIEAGGDLEPGSWVWLKLPGLEARYSRVAWSRGGFAGIEFESALHEAVVDVLAGIERQPEASEVAELRAISERCRSAASRLDERWESEAITELLALAGDCDHAAGAQPQA